MLAISKNTLSVETIGEDMISARVGAPKAWKSAWRTSTINIAMILNSSKLDSLIFVSGFAIV
jgi:hypothetical protein